MVRVVGMSGNEFILVLFGGFVMSILGALLMASSLSSIIWFMVKCDRVAIYGLVIAFVLCGMFWTGFAVMTGAI